MSERKDTITALFLSADMRRANVLFLYYCMCNMMLSLRLSKIAEYA